MVDSEKMMKQTASNANTIGQKSINQKKSLNPHEEKFVEEFNPFRRLKINQLPDSKRTINPELAVNYIYLRLISN